MNQYLANQMTQPLVPGDQDQEPLPKTGDTVTGKSEPRAVFYTKTIAKHLLGRQISFDSQTKVKLQQEGAKYVFNTKTVEVLFGIGKDHSGRLILEEDAWNAFVNGEPIIF